MLCVISYILYVNYDDSGCWEFQEPHTIPYKLHWHSLKRAFQWDNDFTSKLESKSKNYKITIIKYFENEEMIVAVNAI